MDAAAMEATLGHLTTSFTNNRPEMLLFTESLLSVSQSVPVGKKRDASHLLPCNSTITAAVERRAEEGRKRSPQISLRVRSA